jgi:hypothetical protein
MIHVGADIHQRFCYITALEARGKTIRSGPVNNEQLALRRYFIALSERRAREARRSRRPGCAP